MEFQRIADKKRVDFIVQAVNHNIAGKAIILDIGCGNGLISKALGENGHQVTGIDVSEKTILAAKSFNTLPNVEFKVVGAGELPIENNKYDAIICSEVLEHLEEPAGLLQIIFSSLKDTGVLVVTVPNGSGPRELLVTRPVQFLQQNNNIAWKGLSRIKTALGYTGTTVQSSAEDLRHIQFFTKGSLTTLAASAGFKIDKIVASNFMEQVFPLSLFTKKIKILQQIDCMVADKLPVALTSGFMSIWKKI